MPLKTTDTQADKEARYNPGEIYAAEHFPESGVAAGIDQLHAHANDPANATGQDLGGKGSEDQDTQKNASRDDVDSKEKGAGGWKNSFSGGGQPSVAGDGKFGGFLNIAKKKGPLGLIIAALIGGGGLFSGFGAALLPIQAKEALFGSLDDQLAAMDLRTDHMLRAKLGGLSPGVSICTGAKIRCKFTSMSDRQIKKFEKAGFKIDREASSIPTRNKITGFTTPDGVAIKDPGELTKLAKSDPKLRSALRKAYNPKFAGYSDVLANKVFGKFKTDKSSKLTGADDKENDKKLDNASSGEKSPDIKDKGAGAKDDGDGKGAYFTDENGNKVYEKDNPDGFAKLKEKFAGVGDRVNELAGAAGHATSGVLKSGVSGALSATAAADTACTVYNTARAVAAASKILRAIQLVQYAMVFFNEADKIKAGDAKEPDVRYTANKLAELDLNKLTSDETTIDTTTTDANSVVKDNVPNPAYGKSAMDSAGYKTAAYNEAPTLSGRSQQFMVGGGLTGTLANVMDNIASVAAFGTGKSDAANSKQGRANIKDFCHTVQSWWARTAGLIAGIASAIGSFGVLTAISIGASLAIGFAMPFLEAQLADIVAGKVVNHETANVDVGDAMFAGGGSLMGGMAMARGLKPANKSSLKSYLAVAADVKSQNIAMETYEAKDTPFDVYSQYSFLGSLVRKINPTFMKSASSITGAITSIPTFIGSAFSSLVPQASADQVFNEERYSKCTDAGYEDIGIEADIFCNVRYSMPGDELDAESEPAVDYLLETKQIDPETGEAIEGTHYADWKKNCTERTAGWGESDQDEPSDADLGGQCLTDGDVAQLTPSVIASLAKPKTNAVLASTSHVATTQAVAQATPQGEYKYFRVYNIDNSINSGMDDDPVEATAATAPAATGPGTPNAQAPTPTPGLDPITTTYTGAEARKLAGLVADDTNIQWSDSSKAGLKKYAAGETVMNACNEPMGISPYLSSLLLSLTKSRYKLTIEDIGFPGERSCEHDNFQHPKGNAVDIQGIEIIGGESTSPGIDNYDAVTKKVTSQFATDWLALLPTENGKAVRGGIGQGPCGVTPTFPPNTMVDHAFDDSCDHLHVDVRNWNAPNLDEKIDPAAK